MTSILQYCPNFNAIAMQSAANGSKRYFARLRCKMWTCEFCAAKNRQIWRAKLIHHIAQTGGDWSWWTLTAHRYARGEQRSLANLRQGWNKLYFRLKRKFGDFSYARIYEKHADSSYHIHAISSFNFGDIKIRTSRKDGTGTSYSSWLQKAAWETGLGMYTHAADILDNAGHSGFVASYITKYIVKLDAETKAAFGCIRHINVSQNWITKKSDEPLEKWLFKFGVYYEDVLSALGEYAYVDLNTGHIVTIDDFENSYIYPSDFKS